MKTLITFCVISILLLSCDEDSPQKVALRIKENKSSCTDFSGQRECYLVQQGSKIGTDDWDLFYSQINGFEYEPGFVYKLLVLKSKVDDPPMDASSFRYKLIKVISKDPKS